MDASFLQSNKPGYLHIVADIFLVPVIDVHKIQGHHHR